MTTFCPNCGDPHVCTSAEAAEVDKTRLELARIEANRDIRIAELGAQTLAVEAEASVEIAEADAEVTAARARGEADGMETAIAELSGAELVVGDGAAAAELEAVDDGQAAELEPVGAAAPSPPIDAEPPRPPKGRAGWWDNYA